MHAAPPAEALVARPRARRHLAWVLSLARWLKTWAERVLAEHAAAVAKAAVELGGARVRSLPLREPAVVLLPVPLWTPPRGEEPLPPERTDAVSTPTFAEAPTPRLNTLRCIPVEGDVLDVEREAASLHAMPFGFDPDDLLPAEPVAVVAPAPSPALLLQAAALPCEELPPGAPRPSQAVTSFPRDPARDLIALLKESMGTPAQPSVPWSEAAPPSPDEPADAEEMLRQCERLELEPPVE
ncbi:hypothetical protein HJC10_21230 [Corallococcus exiguus]|uniref:hypothetical protein n=1 Tax=Corallococcus TaxID=83461 RepID=UPI000EBE44F8|nr:MULTISPECIES: hypothetical protein [Corallococcus]NNB84345.1 hypothetical protein [Corallococcus exiguus]NNB92926.1 hypothetical protein [Corallococcus exiguus]NNC05364.1 hypothetical protein [Corallococcus exiguus]NPC50803.1 hypothetical protein [Corallococcus exiguus]RKH86282.1 hypothetical protein D7X99_03950 [Corallococcus sp. AB032C]